MTSLENPQQSTPNTDLTSSAPSLQPKIVKRGGGERLELPGEIRHILLDSRDTGGKVALSYSEMQPGMGTPLHVHTREEEIFFIIEGRYHFSVGGQEFEAVPGDFIFAPRHIAHRYQCTSQTPGKMFIWVLNAGFEDFFRAQALMTDMTAEKLTELAAQFGLRIGGNHDDLVPSSLPRVIHLDAETQKAVFSHLTPPQTMEVEVLRAYGDTAHVLVPQDEVGENYVIVWDETPSRSGPPLHIHENADELFVILEGRYEFCIGDASVEVDPGDVIFAPRGIQHCFRVISSENGRAFIMAFPGDFEPFFRESAALFAQGLAPETLMPQLFETAARYGITFVLPSN